MEEYTEEHEEVEETDTKPSKPVTNGAASEMDKVSDKKKGHKSVLIKQERETGLMSFKVLKRYKDALGGWWVVVILFGCYAATETLRILSSTWLSVWTDESTPKVYSPLFYNVIYGLLSLGQAKRSIAFLIPSRYQQLQRYIRQQHLDHIKVAGGRSDMQGRVTIPEVEMEALAFHSGLT